MPKRVPELSPLQLKQKALTPGFHAVGGVAGLHLGVSPTLAASWILLRASVERILDLAAARSGEVRGATWNEVDLHAKVWTIPAERMKGGRAHKVPLCTSAVSLLESLSRDSEYLFHNTKGGALSDVSVSKVPKQLGHDVTLHGFRATFRTWAQEHTNYRDEVCELALAHVNSDSTRAAYARSELLDKRRLLMQDWERFCREGLPARGKVIRIEGKK